LSEDPTRTATQILIDVIAAYGAYTREEAERAFAETYSGGLTYNDPTSIEIRSMFTTDKEQS
jgi:hypothetical protein